MIHTRSHRRRLAAVSFGIALTATFALTSCANPVEKITESIGTSAADKLVSELSGAEIEGIGSSEVPENFPDTVPLPDATVSSGIQHTDEGASAWIIHFEAEVNDAVYDAYLAALADAGFTEESNNDVAGAMRIAQYSGNGYQVIVSLMGGADEEQIMQLQVHGTP